MSTDVECLKRTVVVNLKLQAIPWIDRWSTYFLRLEFQICIAFQDSPVGSHSPFAIFGEHTSPCLWRTVPGPRPGSHGISISVSRGTRLLERLYWSSTTIEYLVDMTIRHGFHSVTEGFCVSHWGKSHAILLLFLMGNLFSSSTLSSTHYTQLETFVIELPTTELSTDYPE